MVALRGGASSAKVHFDKRSRCHSDSCRSRAGRHANLRRVSEIYRVACDDSLCHLRRRRRRKASCVDCRVVRGHDRRWDFACDEDEERFHQDKKPFPHGQRYSTSKLKEAKSGKLSCSWKKRCLFVRNNLQFSSHPQLPSRLRSRPRNVCPTLRRETRGEQDRKSTLIQIEKILAPVLANRTWRSQRNHSQNFRQKRQEKQVLQRASKRRRSSRLHPYENHANAAVPPGLQSARGVQPANSLSVYLPPSRDSVNAPRARRVHPA